MGGHDLSDRGEEKTDLLAQGKPGIISCTFFLTNFLPEADTAAFILRQSDAVCFCANSDRLCTRPIGHLQLNIYWI